MRACIICRQFRGGHYYALFAHYHHYSRRFATGDWSFWLFMVSPARGRAEPDGGGQVKRRRVRLCVSFENLISLIKVPTDFTRAHLSSSVPIFLSLFCLLLRPFCVPDASRACGLAFTGVTRFIKLMKVFFWRWYAKQFYFVYPCRCWGWWCTMWGMLYQANVYLIIKSLITFKIKNLINAVDTRFNFNF